ncbi:MAG: amino acid permease [Gemmatimonadota bacterium]|nr:amino acid permease [Gemmatimonadota bacterium]MDE2873727.1 amino acid permease [Gemmatimonadota bacterium]
MDRIPPAQNVPTAGNGYSPYAATAVVVANMIGTGVFTSLGFQLLDLRSTFPLLLLWVVGGAAAFCGAVSYAELGAAIPRSGGEYTFLSRIYHPVAGFVSGWISATIGFAAPTALAAITFGTYLASVFPSLSPTWLGAGLVLALTGVHATTYRSSSLFQRSFTTAKVLLILAFCAAAVLLADPARPVSLLPVAGDGALAFSGAFAVSLIYVSYAYTGWNAATYLTGELADPERTLPRVLGGGTLLVMVLYTGLNYAFLRAAPMDAMAGKVEVGYVAATHLFGPAGAAIMGVTLAVLLVSTVSAMVMAGPRVLQVIGEDYPLFQRLSRTNRDGIPAVAIATQAALSLAFIATASFETILVFAGFTLGLNSLLAVAGVFVLRVREPDAERPYRAWGFPVTPLVYLALTLCTLTYIAMDRPAEALMAVPLIGSGLVFHLVAAGGRRPGAG